MVRSEVYPEITPGHGCEPLVRLANEHGRRDLSHPQHIANQHTRGTTFAEQAAWAVLRMLVKQTKDGSPSIERKISSSSPSVGSVIALPLSDATAAPVFPENMMAA